MAMTRKEAIDAGFVINVHTEPMIVDITTKLFEAINVNAAPELVPVIIGGMETTIKAKATEAKLSVEQLPKRFDDLFTQWRNWPNVKTGPVCGYVDYSAIFSMDDASPMVLMTLPHEGRPKNV